MPCRCWINRLSDTDRRTGEMVCCYEHKRPGSVLHVDVTMLGNIRDGGARRCAGRHQGDRHRATIPGKPRIRHNEPRMGTPFVRTVLYVRSPVDQAEIQDVAVNASAKRLLKRGKVMVIDRDRPRQSRRWVTCPNSVQINEHGASQCDPPAVSTQVPGLVFVRRVSSRRRTHTSNLPAEPLK